MGMTILVTNLARMRKCSMWFIVDGCLKIGQSVESLKFADVVT